MYRTSNRLIFSATDLVDFLFCEHLTQQELAVAGGLLTHPAKDEEAAEVQRRRGAEHERRYLQLLRDAGRRIVEMPRIANDLESLRAADAATIEAMRSGADVIYQAALFDGQWLGYADFLLRVETPSLLGAFSYEVADTKLARTVKSSAIVQMCSYAEHLDRVQGVPPESIHAVPGDMRVESYRLRDFMAYYRRLKRRFELAALTETGTSPYPEPVDHCSVCRWEDICIQRRREDDHLSLVARMRRDQIRKLEKVGVTTVLALSRAEVKPRGIGEPAFEALRDQARLQVVQRESGDITYELLAPQPDAGLSLLPVPSPGDLFFDMEGDPYVQDGGLEYLFGVLEIGADASPRYHAFWAHDRQEEKAAFESFIKFVMQRLELNPDMHIYHYAPYEPTTLQRLMGTHATCESEVDKLLRGEVFVDLYRVVRQGVRVSQESYSLKMLEPLYMAGRSGEIKQGGDSIVAYERWLESRDPNILNAIAEYNTDDCISTWRLRDWLEARRRDLANRLGQELPRPAAAHPEPPAVLQEAEIRIGRSTDALCADVPVDSAERTPAQHARWLLGQLLQWHRREDKPEWWMYFGRLRKTDEELEEDTEAIGNLAYVGIAQQVGKSNIHRYSFDPSQEHKLWEGKETVDPRTQRSAGEIVYLDSIHGTLDLKRACNSKKPHPRSLIPARPLDNVTLRAAIERVADWVLSHDIEAPGPYRAVRELLIGTPPRVECTNGESLRRDGESPLDAARRLVITLQSSYLPIQGPPGSGKTYTGARVIVDLVRAGKRVGICGPSHRAISNLLDEVMDYAASEGVSVRAIQKAGELERCSSDNVVVMGSYADVEQALRENTVDVVAGTAWLFAREELADALDTLFIDEAGQVSLANTVAVAGSARNLVLLGDPQQLAQPLKGSHPDGAERSALAHALGDRATIAPDSGLLLDTTYRMHPAICEFISDIAYDGRLGADAACALQAIGGSFGLRYLAVDHTGNRTSSTEEAQQIKMLVDSYVGQYWTDRHGLRRRLGFHDIMVVAPYNAQVAMLARWLPEEVRLGTVDKFQGQEAPLVIFSTAASSVRDVPRGLDFLFSLNRLNVAISRARGMAILVGSPSLLQVACATPGQMRLANAFCHFIELTEAPRPLSRGADSRIIAASPR